MGYQEIECQIQNRLLLYSMCYYPEQIMNPVLLLRYAQYVSAMITLPCRSLPADVPQKLEKHYAKIAQTLAQLCQQGCEDGEKIVA